MAVAEIPPTATHVTPIGTLWSSWSEHGLTRLNFSPDPVATTPDPGAPLKTAIQRPCTVQAERLDALVEAYFCRGEDSFRSIVIDTSRMTDFTRRVYELCRSIPHGQTRSYGQLASQLSGAGASRAVGAALARNPLLLVVPCHRVVGVNGRLCGFSAPGGLATKRALLDLEQGQLFSRHAEP